MGEVIMLAERSLAEIGRAHILDLSHMGFLLGLLEACGVEERSVDEALSLISNKNLPGIAAFAAANGLDEAARTLISDVTSIYEPLETALPRLATFVRSEKMRAAYDELSSLCEVMRAWNPNAPLYLDFSIAADRNYYNGIVFRGYVEGIPEAILSGGRYDSLLSRMGRKGEAIGFAVYPELIAGLGAPRRAYDVDAVVLYGEETDACDLIAAVQELSASGKSVRTECGETTETSCREKYRMNGRTAVRV
jgi:ATP phosphoribosyltransferase regulatory subunit